MTSTADFPMAKCPTRRGIALTVCAVLAAGTATADDWPQWLGPQRDGIWRETGLVEAFPADGPPVVWRVPVGGGYSGPAVAGGRVFVTDRVLPQGVSNPANPFDRKTVVRGQERVLALDAATGKPLWTQAYPCDYRISYAAGPRCTPIVRGDRLWTLGAMGDLLCLEAATGRIVWQRSFKSDYDADPPVWGFSASPLLDGERLITLVGGEGAAVVAFDAATGHELWRALTTPDIGYGPPMIYEIAGRRQLIIWHARAIEALDPATGQKLWTHMWPVRYALTAPTIRQIGGTLLASAFYDGARLLRPVEGQPQPELVWVAAGVNEKNTQGLHAIMATPVVRDGHIYGVCSYGQLRCLRADNGHRVWETLEATTAAAAEAKPLRWANAFIIPLGETGSRYLLANESGELILADMTPDGYRQISRAKVLDPTNPDARSTDPNRLVVWCHPALANRRVYIRNDREMVCVSLAAAP